MHQWNKVENSDMNTNDTVYRVQNTLILSYPIFTAMLCTGTQVELVLNSSQFQWSFYCFKLKLFVVLRNCQCEINVLLGSCGSFVSMCFLGFFKIIIDPSIKNYEKECYNYFHKRDILKSMWRTVEKRQIQKKKGQKAVELIW